MTIKFKFLKSTSLAVKIRFAPTGFFFQNNEALEFVIDCCVEI